MRSSMRQPTCGMLGDGQGDYGSQHRRSVLASACSLVGRDARPPRATHFQPASLPRLALLEAALGYMLSP